MLVDPSYERIVQALGFSTEPEAPRCDLAIVGGGPAGLAAAVYGASEGLTTVLVDHAIPGRAGGTSSRIRNYLGFPTGLSGRDLTNRALEQAWFFGARFVLSRRATALAPTGYGYRIDLEDAGSIEAKVVVVATGVTWRRLEVPRSTPCSAPESSTAPRAPTPRRSRARGYSSSAPATRQGRQLCISLQQGHRSRSSCAARRLAASMSDYLVRELRRRPGSRSGSTPRSSAPAAGPTSRASRSATTSTARPRRCRPTSST